MHKRSWILFLCLLVASIVSFTNAEAKFIGPNGGEVQAGKSCKIYILPDTIGNPEIAEDALENAGAILLDLNDYIELKRIKDAVKKIDKAKKHLSDKLYEKAYKEIRSALRDLEKLDSEEMAEEIVEEIVEEMAEEETEEISEIEDKLEELKVKVEEIGFTQAEFNSLIDEVEAELDSLTAEAGEELVVAQEVLGLNISVKSYQTELEYQGETYSFLVFKGNPSGTKFSPAAMLIIPFDKILASDFMILHESQGEPINLIDLEYDIDDENEVVIFYIPGFSYYYIHRR